MRGELAELNVSFFARMLLRLTVSALVRLSN